MDKDFSLLKNMQRLRQVNLVAKFKKNFYICVLASLLNYIPQMQMNEKATPVRMHDHGFNDMCIMQEINSSRFSRERYCPGNIENIGAANTDCRFFQ